jgi:hypothetical protein
MGTNPDHGLPDEAKIYFIEGNLSKAEARVDRALEGREKMELQTLTVEQIDEIYEAVKDRELANGIKSMANSLSVSKVYAKVIDEMLNKLVNSTADKAQFNVCISVGVALELGIKIGYQLAQQELYGQLEKEIH